MRPLMRALMVVNGTPFESPMLTHGWNNTKFGTAHIAKLNLGKMVSVEGDNKARKRGGMGRHLPCVGWQKYVVIEPATHAYDGWYAGWHTSSVTGASLLKQSGRVRLLIGPEPAKFFGIDTSGHQIHICVVGYGRLGHNPEYAEVPLL